MDVPRRAKDTEHERSVSAHKRENGAEHEDEKDAQVIVVGCQLYFSLARKHVAQNVTLTGLDTAHASTQRPIQNGY